MGFESKVIIVNVLRIDEEEKHPYAQIVAEFNMSCMRAGFHSLFTRPTECDVYVENGNEPTKEDKYGDPLKEGDINAVIAFLEKEETDDRYRRIPPLLAFLKAIDPTEWEDIRIIHYGY